METAVLPAWALLAYLASGVLFILALRGLSSPATSRRGNSMGMLGMAIAMVTTLVTLAPIPARRRRRDQREVSGMERVERGATGPGGFARSVGAGDHRGVPEPFRTHGKVAAVDH